VTVVLSTRDRASSDGAGSSGDGEVVWSPVDALREVIRRHATILVIEPGTDDPWPLVHAVANHDRASGGHTRVVQVSTAGVLIDLTAADERDVRQ
jgi:hypothetical protein